MILFLKISRHIGLYLLFIMPNLLLAGDGGDLEGSPVKLENPLNSKTITELLDSILDVIMVFAIPLIVFFIIYAGFQYVMAQGSADKIQNANKALLYAVIGGLIILGAKVILEVLKGTVAVF